MAHRTEKAMYCSQDCNNAAAVARRTEQRRAARAGRSCKNCGGEISIELRNNTEFCSEKCKRALRYEAKGRMENRKHLYGMTADDYAELISQQDQRCAICGTMEWGGKTGEPHVDHDHKTNAVRGLLCAGCNYGLGCFKDDAKQLRAAADYLDDRRRYQACLDEE